MSAQSAQDLVSREFWDYAGEIAKRIDKLIEEKWVKERTLDDFFDARNRDDWMDGFIRHLQEKFQQRDRIASNE